MKRQILDPSWKLPWHPLKKVGGEKWRKRMRTMHVSVIVFEIIWNHLPVPCTILILYNSLFGQRKCLRRRWLSIRHHDKKPWLFMLLSSKSLGA
jgi:hypothetical protein